MLSTSLGLGAERLARCAGWISGRQHAGRGAGPAAVRAGPTATSWVARHGAPEKPPLHRVPRQGMVGRGGPHEPQADRIPAGPGRRPGQRGRDRGPRARRRDHAGRRARGDVTIALGAVIGLSLGIIVSVATDLPLAPEAGLALGALAGWLPRPPGGGVFFGVLSGFFVPLGSPPAHGPP